MEKFQNKHHATQSFCHTVLDNNNVCKFSTKIYNAIIFIGFSSLQSEIHSSLKSSKRTSKKSSKHSSRFESDFSEDSETSHHLPFSKTFSTYKAATAIPNSRLLPPTGDSPVPVTDGYNPGQGSSFNKEDQDEEYYFQSYTVSREVSQSPMPVEEFERLGMVPGLGTNTVTDSYPNISKGHPGIGSIPGFNVLASSSPKRGHPGLGSDPGSGRSSSLGYPSFGQLNAKRNTDVPIAQELLPASSKDVLEVQTIGELHVPNIQHEALASPLGSVPSLSGKQNRESDVTESSLTMSLGQSESKSESWQLEGSYLGGSLGSLPNFEQSSGLSQGSRLGALGSLPGEVRTDLGNVPGRPHSGLGSIPGNQGLTRPDLGSVPGSVRGDLGSVPKNMGSTMQGLGSVPGDFGTVPGNMQSIRGGLGSVPFGGLDGQDYYGNVTENSDFSLTKNDEDRPAPIGKYDHEADGMSDDGFLMTNEFEGGAYNPDEEEEEVISKELEKALQNLTPEAVEKRRMEFSRRYRY